MLTCKSCSHFLGGGDWALCCNIKDNLCYADTPACADFKSIDSGKGMTKRRYRQLSNLVADIQFLDGIDDKPCVFMDMSGHVLAIDIRVYEHGWKRNEYWDQQFYIYMGNLFDKALYDECVTYLRGIRDRLRAGDGG